MTSFPCFLLDENMPHRTIRRLLGQREPGMHLWFVGQHSAPALGTEDPELLIWIEEHDCLLVTRNRASMPRHLRDHLAMGRHIPGVLICPIPLADWKVAEELQLVWAAMRPDEYVDQIVYLPA
jgi:hypothetical protein